MGIIHKYQRQEKTTLKGKQLCTWVEEFFFLTLRKEQVWVFCDKYGSSGVSQYKGPGQWHVIRTHPWTHSKILCKFISCGGADLAEDTTLFFPITILFL